VDMSGFLLCKFKEKCSVLTDCNDNMNSVDTNSIAGLLFFVRFSELWSRATVSDILGPLIWTLIIQ
jgi:hypothetical protein